MIRFFCTALSAFSAWLICALVVITPALSWQFTVTAPNTNTFRSFGQFLKNTTSLTAHDQVKQVDHTLSSLYESPWLFSQDLSFITTSSQTFKPKILRWLLDGGTLIIEGKLSKAKLENLVKHSILQHKGQWQGISVDHEIQRSFYLLRGMPRCDNHSWSEFRYEKRMMILHAPSGLVDSVTDHGSSGCFDSLTKQTKHRLMTNLIMVILTTDYKKDQIHIAEILKRIR